MNKYPFRNKAWLVVIVLVAALGLAWNVALGAPLVLDPGPEIAVSPGYEQEIDGGGAAAYTHVVTNTGDVAGALALVPAIPDGWEIAYATPDYPQGTATWLPLPLSPDDTLSLTIFITAPLAARSGLYTSTITVTLLAEPPATAVVYERTRIRPRSIYLPLVLRNYVSFANGSFENGLAGWTATQAPLPVTLVSAVSEYTGGSTSPSDGTHAVLLGKIDYACSGVPLGFAAVKQTFVVPPEANTLRFDYVVWSQDASPDQRYDRFEVYVWRADQPISITLVYSDGNQVNEGLGCDRWWRVPETGWKSGTIDLLAYRGKLITVSFENWNRYDNWYNTYTYLDNVRIQ